MAKGIYSRGDLLVLSDGTNPNDIWSEFNAALDIANSQRSALTDLLCFRTTDKHATVLQSSGGDEFEIASEFGVPSGARIGKTALQLGFPFRWYDRATRWTWQYLADASEAEVSADHNSAIAADYRLEMRLVLEALFKKANRTGDPSTDATVYALWNGDGAAIPDYNGSAFNGATHTHYTTTNSATLDAADLELLISQPMHHGYGVDDGARIVVLTSLADDVSDTIQSFRAGTGGAKHDFIPSDTSIPYLTTETLVGQRPQGSFQGIKIVGQYGDALIAAGSPLIPAGYLASVAVGGATPVLGLREHANRRGLQLIRGNNADYPIQDAYYVRGMGVGVRQRGAAACMQVTAIATYTDPTIAG
jgi:hypothetical protein